MQYAILIYGDETIWHGLGDAERQAVYAAHMAYGKRMTEAGVIRGGAELQPVTTATTIRLSGDKPVTREGPFAETREQLGGFYLIECATRAEAERWAAENPSLPHGCVELRPLNEPG
ncbi:MAG: YciI family protein [Gemmatimonadales bacterium]|nr:YciI family protein [Gemmatimonadales bacterium]